MKRNRYGINLDEGIPLCTENDFVKLHVPCFSEVSLKIAQWILESSKPLLLGGQIGSGKTTLINKVIRETHLKPDIIIYFDKEVLNLDSGDFWGITLAAFIKAALERRIDLSFCKLPNELGQYAESDWSALYNGLEPVGFSMDAYATRMSLRRKIAENAGYIREVVKELGTRMNIIQQRKLFIVAAGLDKFDTASAAFLSLQDIIETLSGFKTLYEVNAVHFFQRPGGVFYGMDRLFIPVASHEDIIILLSKRMGEYHILVKEEIKIIAHWSGGNPRQALRLLSHFQNAKRIDKLTRNDCLLRAINETAGDFFAYAPMPSQNLIQSVNRSGKLKTSLVTLPGDKETARLALYGNWIFIKESSDPLSWEAFVNPLIKAAFKNVLTTQDPEIILLSKFAETYGISSYGIGVNREDEKTGDLKNADRLLWDILSSGVEHPLQTNLSEVFDILSAALLSKNRADRAIIAYENPDIAKAARAYLFAKANSYEYQQYNHYTLEGGPGKNPLEILEKYLQDDVDIISLEITGDWLEQQLTSLDKQRDRLLNKEMIWWIPKNNLKIYLSYWTQLRQLFEVFILEDELLGSLSQDDIKEDIAFFESLVENEKSAEAHVVNNLKVVLEYLDNVRKADNHG